MAYNYSDSKHLKGWDNLTETEKENRDAFQRLLSNTFHDSTHVYEPSDVAKKLREVTDIIDDLFTNGSEKDIEKFLSGELNLNRNLVQGYTYVPLYLILDLTTKLVERKIDKFQKDDKIEETLEKMKELREKAAQLEFDRRFDPNEELSPRLIDKIEKSRFIDIDMAEVENISHLSVTIYEIHDLTENKNGDIRINGVDETKSTIPLYKKDYDAINEIQQKRTMDNIERLNAIASRYFKDGKIPELFEFDDKLTDKELSGSIQSILLSISYEKSEHKSKDLGNLANSLAKDMDELEDTERRIEQVRKEREAKEREREEKERERRKQAIESSKKRYKELNPWEKFKERKNKPSSLDYESMSTEQIEGLYSKKEGKGK